MLLAGFSSSCSEQFNNRKMLQGGGGTACPACFPEGLARSPGVSPSWAAAASATSGLGFVCPAPRGCGMALRIAWRSQQLLPARLLASRSRCR